MLITLFSCEIDRLRYFIIVAISLTAALLERLGSHELKSLLVSHQKYAVDLYSCFWLFVNSNQTEYSLCSSNSGCITSNSSFIVKLPFNKTSSDNRLQIKVNGTHECNSVKPVLETSLQLHDIGQSFL